jgi:hypothetical protein
MYRKTLAIVTAACLMIPGAAALAEEGGARAPLAKPGDTYVSLQVEGCAARCPSFEIYVFSNGRAVFRSNNQYTAAKGRQHKNGMPNIHKEIAKYLEQSQTFAAHPECAQGSEQATIVTVQSARDSQVEKSTWSTACADQRAKARAVAKVFVNQTGMWKLIHSDTRYWEKYWEDPAMTGREDVVQ